MNRKKRVPTCTARQSLRSVLGTSPRAFVSAILVVAVVSALCSGRAHGKPNGQDASAPEPVVDPRLLQVKRICVENFGEDPLGKQATEVAIAKLFDARQFTLMEGPCEKVKADAVVKGSVSERSEHTIRSESEGVSAGRGAAGAAASSSSVTVGAAGGSVSAHESLSSSQTKEYAAVTLRVVCMNSDACKNPGEILWAFSQESTGGKTKGAIGDAAERAVRRFLRDRERAEKQRQSKTEKPSQP